MDCSVAQSPSAGRSPGDILLAIDIGNTQTVLGIFAGEELVTFRRVSSGVARTGDELAVLIAALCRGHNQRITRAGRIVISSVVPALTQEYEVMCERLYARRPLVVTSRTRAGVRLEVPDPASIGADRIANAAAVAGGMLPAIVVDLGTATTFDVVRPGRRYVGGAIAPGIRTSADELFRRAARLARVEIRQPLRRIGVRRLEEDLRRPARIVATGGLAPLIGAGSETIQEVDEALTLRGLLRIVRLNS